MCPGRDAPALACSWDEGGREGCFPWDGARRSGSPCGVRGCWARLCPCRCPGQPPPRRGAPGVPACPGEALLVWIGVIASTRFAPQECCLAGISEAWGPCLTVPSVSRNVGPLPYSSGCCDWPWGQIPTSASL